jgi:hypothetical protein
VNRYVLAGAAVGLAASAKYNAALAAVAVVVAHVLRVSGADRRSWRSWRSWGTWALWRDLLRQSWLLLVAGVTGLMVFLLLNPGALIDRHLFVEGLRFESEHYRQGHPGAEGDSLAFHLSWLWRGFGPALLLAPLGLVARERNVRRVAVVAWSFVVVYVGFISTFPVRFARNLLPVTVPLAATVALGLVALLDHVRSGWRWWPVGLRVTLVAALCLAVLAWPAGEAGDTLTTALPDPWSPAQEWIRTHVPPGAKVGVEAYGIYVDPERYQVHATATLTDHTPAWYRDQGFALLVVGQRNFQRFLDDPAHFPEQARAYEALLDAACTRFRAGPEGEEVLLLDPGCVPAG